MAGAVLGTLDYMPPEQRRDSLKVDARTDLWSLAATLYTMVTGKSPKVILLDNLSKSLRVVLSQALDENPKDRFERLPAFRKFLINKGLWLFTPGLFASQGAPGPVTPNST